MKTTKTLSIALALTLCSSLALAQDGAKLETKTTRPTTLKLSSEPLKGGVSGLFADRLGALTGEKGGTSFAVYSGFTSTSGEVVLVEGRASKPSALRTTGLNTLSTFEEMWMPKAFATKNLKKLTVGAARTTGPTKLDFDAPVVPKGKHAALATTALGKRGGASAFIIVVTQTKGGAVYAKATVLPLTGEK